MFTMATIFSRTRSHRPSVRGTAADWLIVARCTARRPALYMKDVMLSTRRPRALARDRLRRDRGEASGEDVEPFVELVVGDRERRQEPDHVAEGSRRDQDHAARAGEAGEPVGFVLGGLARLTIADELDADHRAAPADVADEGTGLPPLLRIGLDARADRLASPEEVSGLEQIEHRMRRGA